MMSAPDHFEVSYRINPWMDPAQWSVSAERLAHDARRGWAALNLPELWRYRELLWFLALRDIQVRYKQTALGAGMLHRDSHEPLDQLGQDDLTRERL